MNCTSVNIFTQSGKKPASSLLWTAYPFSPKKECLVTTLPGMHLVSLVTSCAQRHDFSSDIALLERCLTFSKAMQLFICSLERCLCEILKKKFPRVFLETAISLLVQISTSGYSLVE
jgi:hypothetical protein